MKKPNSTFGNPIVFVALTFLLSMPFYILNALAYFNILGKSGMASLYIALFTFTPIASASILTLRSRGKRGLRELLIRIFDFKRIANRRWYLVIILIPAFLSVLSLFLTVVFGNSVPDAMTPFVALPALILFFFLLATGEEVGWMGYSFEPMEEYLGALRAALVLGTIWAFWHVPFFIFIFPDPFVLAAQFFTLVGTRVLVVWIFNNTGKSVFAAILYHTFGNAVMVTFPEIKGIIPWGSIIYCVLILIAAIVVTLLWGPKSLARYRFTRK